MDVATELDGGEQIRLTDVSLAAVVVWLLDSLVPASDVRCAACGHGPEQHPDENCQWPRYGGPPVTLCTCQSYVPVSS